MIVRLTPLAAGVAACLRVDAVPEQAVRAVLQVQNREPALRGAQLRICAAASLRLRKKTQRERLHLQSSESIEGGKSVLNQSFAAQIRVR